MRHHTRSFMTKSFYLIFSFLLGGLLISCSGENLYEYGFEDLTHKSDYVIQVVVIPKDTNEDFEFQTIFFKTDGYGELSKKYLGYDRSGEFEVISSAVKEYKKVGVTFIPKTNISRVEVKIYDILFDDSVVVWRGFDEVDGEITVSYDFERNKEEIIRE